jgi:hypothetical protein
MEAVCLNEIKTIINQKEGVSVSIFMPLQNGADSQNLIRFKNLLHKAEEKLALRGLRVPEVRSLLHPAENLITDKPFWSQRGKGMAFYLDTDRYFYYRVPSILPESVIVGPRFSVRPLVSLLSECGVYYILALSQKENRLLQCTSAGSVRIELKNIPANLSESIHGEVPDSRVQYRSSASKTAFGESFQVSGSGSLADVNKAYILKYFEEISKGVSRILQGENVPLLLAGVDYLHPLYRQANKYANLLKEGIQGSPDALSDEVLREQGLSIVKPFFEKAKLEAVTELTKNAVKGKIASGEMEVIPAAFNGRVRYLFVDEEALKWGTFDSSQNLVKIHPIEENEDEELIDLAVFYTLKNEGTVYTLKSGEIPGGKDMTAILRY